MLYDNKIYDGKFSWVYVNYTKTIKNSVHKKKSKKKEWFIDKIVNTLFPSANVSKQKWNKNNNKIEVKSNKNLEEQIKWFLKLPDNEYSDSKLTSELRNYLLKQDQEIDKANANIKQKIAPSSFDIGINEVNVSGMYARTYYANSYPSVIDFLWTRWVVNLDGKYDSSWFIYPTEKATIASALKKRATQVKVEINDAMEKIASCNEPALPGQVAQSIGCAFAALKYGYRNRVSRYR